MKLTNLFKKKEKQQPKSFVPVAKFITVNANLKYQIIKLADKVNGSRIPIEKLSLDTAVYVLLANAVITERDAKILNDMRTYSNCLLHVAPKNATVSENVYSQLVLLNERIKDIAIECDCYVGDYRENYC